MNREIIVIAHNLRSSHNIGSLLRTADGLGVHKVYLSGYSPYPISPNDQRLPYLAVKTDKQIRKTSLGAETSVAWEHIDDIKKLIKDLKQKSYQVAALEQSKQSIALEKFVSTDKVAIILGREVEGIESDILKLADCVVEIPMLGKKESLNVVQAAAIAIYKLRYF